VKKYTSCYASTPWFISVIVDDISPEFYILCVCFQQRFGDSAGQLLDANQTSMLKSVPPHGQPSGYFFFEAYIYMSFVLNIYIYIYIYIYILSVFVCLHVQAFLIICLFCCFTFFP
jgi:hypothetical protein